MKTDKIKEAQDALYKFWEDVRSENSPDMPLSELNKKKLLDLEIALSEARRQESPMNKRRAHN